MEQGIQETDKSGVVTRPTAPETEAVSSRGELADD